MDSFWFIASALFWMLALMQKDSALKHHHNSNTGSEFIMRCFAGLCLGIGVYKLFGG